MEMFGRYHAGVAMSLASVERTTASGELEQFTRAGRRRQLWID
jgi:hypothetical protein